MIKLFTKAYGEGEFISYDPRFPGYFSGKFNIKGKDVVIDNLKKIDIKYISEEYEAEVIKNDCADLTIKTICNRAGYKVLIKHQIQFNPQNDVWIVRFNDEPAVFEYRYCNAPTDKYDLKDFLKIEDFKY